MSTNPRPVTPNTDHRLHSNVDPSRSLVEELGGIVDEARQMVTDLGLRPYQVWSVVVRWSGGERHRGTASVRSELQFLPTPNVDGVARVSKDLREGGSVVRGTVRMTELSPRYTEDDIELLFPRSTLAQGEEHFIEVRHDARDGRTERRRYVVSALPERRPGRFDWEVQLTKQDEDRTRRGAPR